MGTLTPVIKKIIEIISDRRKIFVEAKVLKGDTAINEHILEFFNEHRLLRLFHMMPHG